MPLLISLKSVFHLNLEGEVACWKTNEEYVLLNLKKEIKAILI